jgi:hypothetical protein
MIILSETLSKANYYFNVSLFTIVIILNPIPVSAAQLNIVSSNSPGAKTIHMSQLTIQRIFTKKEIYWSDGTLINNVYIKPITSIEHQFFLLNYLHMTLFRYQQLLDAAIYTGKTTPVIENKDDIEMEINIKTHPGSIGYVNYQLRLDNSVVICDDC